MLPSYDELFALAGKTADLLENEICIYREKAKNGKAGGLLDFSDLKIEKLPLIVVPDLHARYFFFRDILDFVLPEDFVNGGENNGAVTVREALSKNLVRVVLVGDLLHSEARGAGRWICAWEEFDKGNFENPFIIEEMEEGLALLVDVMKTKCSFPANFHILKGNHENILNETGGGNLSFRKFANEGEMVRLFMESYYGEEMVYVISCFEKALPLISAFGNCVISHAEPKKAFSRKELIDGLLRPEVVNSLTWTGNGDAFSGSVEALLSLLTTEKNLNNVKYFGGHRPVKGNFQLRQNGLYVQIHNPELENVVLVREDKAFNSFTDIVNVKTLKKVGRDN